MNRNLKKGLITLILAVQFVSQGAWADDKAVKRNFYEVLADLMADYEYDLKNGEVKGLKNLSIRNIAVSENIPKSFNRHLELNLTEKTLAHANTKIIQCLPCRSKRAMLSGDNVTISSPETNPKELSRIAKISGIENFMDVAFSYQPTGMVMSMYIVDAELGNVVWSRSYNSETSRAAAFRKGVDYSQTDEARRSAEYEPMVQSRVIIYYLFEPNVSGTTGTLGLGYRMMERYSNRTKEVGFEIDYLLDSNSIVGSSDTSTQNLYNGLNITLLFVHAWNFIGQVENYNQVRGSFFAAIGGTYTSGYLGGLVRAGYEWRLGKHWAISGNVGYRPSATAFLNGTENGNVSGLEFGIGISALF